MASHTQACADGEPPRVCLALRRRLQLYRWRAAASSYELYRTLELPRSALSVAWHGGSIVAGFKGEYALVRHESGGGESTHLSLLPVESARPRIALTPPEERRRAVRLRRIVAAQAAQREVDPVAMDLLDFPIIEHPDDKDPVLPDDLKFATTAPEGEAAKAHAAVRGPDVPQHVVSLERTPMPAQKGDATPGADDADAASDSGSSSGSDDDGKDVGDDVDAPNDGGAPPSSLQPAALSSLSSPSAHRGAKSSVAEDQLRAGERARRQHKRDVIGDATHPLRRPGVKKARDEDIARRGEQVLPDGSAPEKPVFRARPKQRKP